MKKIRQWIQGRKDARFLRRLERVLDNYAVNASPAFNGKISSRDDMEVVGANILIVKEKS